MADEIRIPMRCDNCGQVDDHPKMHYGVETYHHDCMPYKVIRDLTTYGYWYSEPAAPGTSGQMQVRWVEGDEIPKAELPKQIAEALAIREFAQGGMRGEELAKRITSGKALVIKGGSGTSGLSSRTTSGIAQLVIAAINGGTALSITTPLKVLFLSTIRTNNDNTGTTDVEWSTSGGYTNGTGFSGITFAAATNDTTGAHQNSNVAATITNAPSQTWAGCIIKDSAGTPKETWYAPVSPSKTVNAGDTVTVPSGSFQTNLG